MKLYIVGAPQWSYQRHRLRHAVLDRVVPLINIQATKIFNNFTQTVWLKGKKKSWLTCPNCHDRFISSGTNSNNYSITFNLTAGFPFLFILKTSQNWLSFTFTLRTGERTLAGDRDTSPAPQLFNHDSAEVKQWGGSVRPPVQLRTRANLLLFWYLMSR